MQKLLSAIALLGLLVSAAAAQDPVKVSPEHYKVILENDLVRVLRATRGPHEKAPMHEHPEYVAVYLTDIHQKITGADGKVQDVNRKVGETSHSASTKHAEENVSDKPLEVIVVELKPGRSRSVPVSAALDPVKISPAYYKVELENDAMRIVRANRAPHSKVPLHEHPAYVAVYLTDVHQKTTDAEGKVSEATRKAGEVTFNKPLKHAEENVSDQPFEAVLIELK